MHSIFVVLYRNETQIERYIRQLPSTSAFPFTTLIRIGYYYQNLMTFFVPTSTNIEFRYPFFSDRRIPFYDVRDTGHVVSECFRQPERWSNGPAIPIVAEQLTMEDICNTIRQMATKEVKFTPLPYEEAIRKLHREIVTNMRWYSEIGSIDEGQADRTKEIYPNMRKFTDWFQETNRLLE
jgi:hypothetical protein